MTGAEVALYVLGAVALVAGVAGTVLPALPGAPLLAVGVLLVAWAGHFVRVGWATVVASTLIAALMLVVDWLAAFLGAKAFGASRWAMLGAGIGALVGIFLGLPGIILGPAVGAIAFELWKNPHVGRALKAGVGAFIGFVVGSAVKVALAFVIVALLVFALAT